MEGGFFFAGVDVGTGSVRAGIFNEKGDLVGTDSHPLQTEKYVDPVTLQLFCEQSSNQIWDAVCKSVRGAISKSGVQDVSTIVSIGFDATCSLVAIKEDCTPVCVSLNQSKTDQNVIVWMDHRATEQADRINSLGHEVLKFTGGSISPEMEMPKLMWIKEKLPYCWKTSEKFFDLSDFLVYKATGQDVRSSCAVVCKCNYIPKEAQKFLSNSSDNSVGWNQSFLESIDMEDIGLQRMGSNINEIGKQVGTVSSRSARELGLSPSTCVSPALIDAHAGGLACLGINASSLKGEQEIKENISRKMVIVAGTSSCHMASSFDPIFSNGIWGPYISAMIPGMWLNEGGQSATGSLIDHIISSHRSLPELDCLAKKLSMNRYATLNYRIKELSKSLNLSHYGLLTKNLHVLPYFHGNRSPIADPSLRGSIDGLNLCFELDDLCLLYLATIQALACGTKHIIENLESSGYSKIEELYLCGGLSSNDLFVQEHSEVTGRSIIIPKENNASLLGSAIIGASSSQRFPNIYKAMSAMSHIGKTFEPQANLSIRKFYDKKFKVFREMYNDQMKYRKIME